ncbi:MAG: hypothetical protein ACRC62_03560 [Microcoleus sp.]
MGVNHIDLTRKVAAWQDTWYTQWIVVDPAKPIIVQPNVLTAVPMSRYKQGLKNPANFFFGYTDIAPWLSFLTTAINIKMSGFLTFSFDISGIRQVRIKHTTVGTEFLDFETFNTQYHLLETTDAVKELNQNTVVSFSREKFAFDSSGWDKELFSERISLSALHSAPVPLQILAGQITLSVEGESI